MSKKRVAYYGSAVALVLILCVAYAVFMGRGVQVGTDTTSVLSLPATPLDATYRFGGDEVALVRGVGEVNGTTTRFTVRSVSEPVYGDLNDDGEDDAVTACSYEAEDKATPCLLLAMHAYGGYVGMNALMLEAPVSGVEVRHGVAYIHTLPGGEVYAAFIGSKLIRVSYERGERLLAGRVTRAGEGMLTFTPCGGSLLSIANGSPAYAAVEATYAARLLESSAPTSGGMFTVVVAREESAGSAAELMVEQVVAVPSREDACTEQDKTEYRTPFEPVTSATDTPLLEE